MLRMNGAKSKIEILKPFGEAFELMKRILFQPFDLKKWLVIGFAAFLAGLSGGFGSSFNPFSRWSTRSDQKAISQSLHGLGAFGHMEWWRIALIVVTALIILALILAAMWLGARGRFIFADCVIRNRAAIGAPWKESRAQGNSFFLFSILIVLLLTALAVVGVLGLALPLIFEGADARPGLGLIIAFCVFLFFVVCLAFGWVVISQLMVPIMYRQRCLATNAFRQTVSLITAHPGPVILYVLFFVLLVVAAAMIGCAAACVTCCIAAIPYIGTVILLPIRVTLSAFSLLFLRQFGPDYDVWASFTPPEFLPILLPLPSVPATSAPSSNLPPEPPSTASF